jgi:UTP-glucose-1-phosphate uridylyltransferase
MAAFTVGSSKEFLSVGGRPIIEWVLEEALAVAARCIIVTSPDKPQLFDYQGPRVEIAVQNEPIGMGPAVCLDNVDDDVLVLNPDTIFFPSSPLPSFLALLEPSCFCVAVEEVLAEQVSKYGIVELNGAGGQIEKLLEKPQPNETKSRLAVAGRFGMSREVYRFVKNWVALNPPSGQEQHLTPVLSLALQAGFAGRTRTLLPTEMRLDCGSPDGYDHACEVVTASL